MDWLKYPYTRKARFFNGQREVLVDLIWYPTDKPFLPFTTVFGSKKYSDNAANKHGLGEVWYPSTPKPNFHKGIKGLNSDHFCGSPSQFMYGQGAPANPPTQYDVDRIPLCCERSPFAQVTAGVRPASVVSQVMTDTTYVTAGVRPASLVEVSNPYRPLIEGGCRPTATVEYVPTIAARVTGGVRPASVVQYWTDKTYVTGGVRPASVVSQVHVVRPEVTVGAYPAAPITPTNTTCHTAYPLGLNTGIPFGWGPGTYWWYIGEFLAGDTFWIHRFTDDPVSGTANPMVGTNCGDLVYVAPSQPCPGRPNQLQFTMPADGKFYIYSPTDQTISPAESFEVLVGPVVC